MEATVTTMSKVLEDGLGMKHLPKFEKGRSWLDSSLAWIVPTRGMVDLRVPLSWMEVDWPMNQIRTGVLSVRGMEVAAAYERLVEMCTDEEVIGAEYQPGYASLILSTKFILSTEDDNIIPSNAVLELLGSIYTCPDCGGTPSGDDWFCENGHRGYDGVSGLYFTKSIPPRPMAYGNPENGPDDMRPVSVTQAIRDKATIEVNGIGMGCALWRKHAFRKVSKPWFETIQVDHVGGSGGSTQDLYFCKKAKAEIGSRFGVNCAVKVGHIAKTGEVF